MNVAPELVHAVGGSDLGELRRVTAGRIRDTASIDPRVSVRRIFPGGRAWCADLGFPPTSGRGRFSWCCQEFVGSEEEANAQQNAIELNRHFPSEVVVRESSDLSQWIGRLDLCVVPGFDPRSWSVLLSVPPRNCQPWARPLLKCVVPFRNIWPVRLELPSRVELRLLGVKRTYLAMYPLIVRLLALPIEGMTAEELVWVARLIHDAA